MDCNSWIERLGIGGSNSSSRSISSTQGAKYREKEAQIRGRRAAEIPKRGLQGSGCHRRKNVRRVKYCPRLLEIVNGRCGVAGDNDDRGSRKVSCCCSFAAVDNGKCTTAALLVHWIALVVTVIEFQLL